MIEVRYYPELNRLRMTGHAKSGEAGHDLVCAAASILAYTFAGNVENLCGEGLAEAPVIEMAPGDTTVSCAAKRRHIATVRLALESVCVGFELLAQSYPGNIQFQRMWVRE